MTKDAGANTYSAPESTTLLWKDGNHESAIVNAYTAEGTDFTVQTDQSTAANVLASDLLGAVKATENTDITISGNNIEVDFRHLLCKLDVTYTWGSELEVETITDKSIKSVKYVEFGSEVTIDRATATVQPTATADIAALMTDMTSEAIFAPYVGEAAKIVITIETTTDNSGEAVTTERVFAINVPVPTGGFVSGNRYTMGIKIGGTVAEISRISVTKWTEQPISDVETDEAVEVSTLEDFEAAIAKGGIVVMTGDITLDNNLPDFDNATIDLNGYTLTPHSTFGLYISRGTLTLTGEGTVNGEVWAVEEGTVNLQGGTVEAFWVDSGGTANISGGHVETLSYNNDGTVIITGGTFGFDPTNYLAEGYTATEADGIWTVAPSNN